MSVKPISFAASWFLSVSSLPPGLVLARAQSNIMEEPMCLIENNPNEQLRVNQEALKILQSIQQPVVVVAIVGLYRTGKSYLMNKLAGKDKGGFSLGATVQAATKGIWMWCRSHPLKPDHTLVLLDTEGLGDVEKSNPENDAWIFALSILLSSTFVYNSFHTIDQYALEKLHYVSELSEHIKVKTLAGQSSNSNYEMPDDYAFFFPTFIWTVRDFTLQLELDGCPISEDEYLEHALKMRKDAPEKQDLPKKFLRQYFPNRKCFAFECPASRKDLADLEDLPESRLSAEFVKQTRCFCNYIYENAQAKVIQAGRLVTGTSLGSLVETYVDSIRNGSMPCIENAVVALAQIENQAAVKDALNRYEAMVDLMLMPPTDDIAEVLQVHAACEEEAIRVFLGRAFKDKDQEHQRELGRQLQEKLQELCTRNEQASSDRCLAVLMELFQEMEERTSNGEYAVPGGYQRFIEDQKKIVENYHLVPDKGVMASQALQDFLESKETAAQAILQADQTLTNKQKELEAEKVRAEAARREAELRRRMQEQAEQMIREKDRSYEEHKRQLLAKMEEDRRALLAANERLLNQKLQEQRRLQQEGYQQEFSRLQSQVQSLESQIQQQRSQRSGRCVIS